MLFRNLRTGRKNFIEEGEVEGRGMKRKTRASNFAQVAVQQSRT